MNNFKIREKSTIISPDVVPHKIDYGLKKWVKEGVSWFMLELIMVLITAAR